MDKIKIPADLISEAEHYAKISRSFTSDRHDFHEGGLSAKQRKMFEGKLGEKLVKHLLQLSGLPFQEDRSSHTEADAYDFIFPNGRTLEDFVTQVRLESKVLLLADVDSVESAQQAEALGFDAVATTLSGYTEIPVAGLPNIKLIEEISRKVQIPIIAEGGFNQPQSVSDAFNAGALSVCIGTAITNPYLLTKHFLTAIN